MKELKNNFQIMSAIDPEGLNKEERQKELSVSFQRSCINIVREMTPKELNSVFEIHEVDFQKLSAHYLSTLETRIKIAEYSTDKSTLVNDKFIKEKIVVEFSELLYNLTDQFRKMTGEDIEEIVYSRKGAYLSINLENKPNE